MKGFFKKYLLAAVLGGAVFSLSFTLASAAYVNDIFTFNHYSRGATANATNVFDYNKSDGDFYMTNVFGIYNSNGVNGTLKTATLKATVTFGGPFYTNLFLWDNNAKDWTWRSTAIHGEVLGKTYSYSPNKAFNDANGSTYVYNTVVTNPHQAGGTEVRQYTHINLK
ncbi:hypothetical protein DFO70_12549 [Cytobacillus firmus]|uniref:Uncharacterized protein n=2 Tax=Cytobacillus TaxID=2675230 RepID=A0A366JJ67_CYTFI|nr:MULTISPECIES: hypothetical protein [Cytobacillus]RBP86581.1 hypothetical protein DFO70_12549 [Cytobacillus firmus]TDX39322.1 hypothetical protein DFO72_111153 [Cytobacillus oceanisediminis]